MPASNPKVLEKARQLPADGLIFDLEDAVAPDAKSRARELAAKAAHSKHYGARERIVRINGLDTEWASSDIARLAESGANALLVPKVENAATVREVESRMIKHGANDEMAIWCMIETPMGVLHAEEIAAASPRMGCLVMGTSDLTVDLHAAHTANREPMHHSLSHTILVARAYGLAVLDGVSLGLGGTLDYARQCKQGAELGFDGKTCFHPSQLAAANEAFSPSAESIAWARKITTAFAEVSREGKAVVLVDGELIENLHIENAKRLIALADAIETLQASAG
jgi:citrate lyase subunit beta/citryl-CoA lyase